jgi:hypothetical protein
MYREKIMGRHTETVGTYKTRREASEEINAAYTLTSDFQLPELQKIHC